MDPSFFIIALLPRSYYAVLMSALSLAFLEDIRAHRIPVDSMELFDSARVPFYDGMLLDYRPLKPKDPPLEIPGKSRVALHPTGETLYAGISDTDVLEVEASILLSTAPPLCLDPDPHLTRIVNHTPRASTPSIHASLKCKAAAVTVEEDESEKVGRAKTVHESEGTSIAGPECAFPTPATDTILNTPDSHPTTSRFRPAHPINSNERSARADDTPTPHSTPNNADPKQSKALEIAHRTFPACIHHNPMPPTQLQAHQHQPMTISSPAAYSPSHSSDTVKTAPSPAHRAYTRSPQVLSSQPPHSSPLASGSQLPHARAIPSTTNRYARYAIPASSTDPDARYAFTSASAGRAGANLGTSASSGSTSTNACSTGPSIAPSAAGTLTTSSTSAADAQLHAHVQAQAQAQAGKSTPQSQSLPRSPMPHDTVAAGALTDAKRPANASPTPTSPTSPTRTAPATRAKPELCLLPADHACASPGCSAPIDQHQRRFCGSVSGAHNPAVSSSSTSTPSKSHARESEPGPPNPTTQLKPDDVPVRNVRLRVGAVWNGDAPTARNVDAPDCVCVAPAGGQGISNQCTFGGRNGQVGGTPMQGGGFTQGMGMGMVGEGPGAHGAEWSAEKTVGFINALAGATDLFTVTIPGFAFDRMMKMFKDPPPGHSLASGEVTMSLFEYRVTKITGGDRASGGRWHYTVAAKGLAVFEITTHQELKNLPEPSQKHIKPCLLQCPFHSPPGTPLSSTAMMTLPLSLSKSTLEALRHGPSDEIENPPTKETAEKSEAVQGGGNVEEPAPEQEEKSRHKLTMSFFNLFYKLFIAHLIYKDPYTKSRTRITKTARVVAAYETGNWDFGLMTKLCHIR
ncbi:hypothetical protein BJ138DRAFT_1128010 [Hygrophoropsis aurantiaca]|uniref:Uncharacterized protein n=1 Tax=Hygrophoropsis aurantiaca TaxID=72124 RepID=A0ACB8A7F7_9AGAM|nr:hypothetical protein BJ138DRAFT_1128010 [Hygrophoropsis aurantiaca]